MSPRTGRPTDNPKKNRLEIRLSDTENELLEKDSQKSKATKTELLMEGYAMSRLITGEELKERLIREYENLTEINRNSQRLIQKVQGKDCPFTEEEKLKAIERSEESIKQNDWVCKVIKNQLKREFDYEI